MYIDPVMTIENTSPDLLREFEAIEKALVTAAEERSFGPAETAAELLGLREQVALVRPRKICLEGSSILTRTDCR